MLPARVTELEAQRLEETQEDREAFRKMLRDEVERQAREKNIQIRLPKD
jgi:Arc/MetJ family transcription regulator